MSEAGIIPALGIPTTKSKFLGNDLTHSRVSLTSSPVETYVVSSKEYLVGPAEEEVVSGFGNYSNISLS